MISLLTMILVFSGLAIIGLVLIQHGKGADMGASFGSGASQTVFGSAGTGNVLTKSTSWLAVLFFAACLGLAVLARHQGDNSSLLLSSDAAAKEAVKTQDAPAAGANDAPAQAAASDVPAAQPQAKSEDVPAATVEQDKQTKQN